MIGASHSVPLAITYERRVPSDYSNNIVDKFERIPVYHRSNKIAIIEKVFIGCLTNRKYPPIIISGTCLLYTSPSPRDPE